MNTAIEVSHVAIDGHGRAWIDDTNVKVIEVVRDHLAYGWSPEEIHWQHPNLNLAQIYAALAYYHDHRVAMDVEIHNSLESANAASRLAADSPARTPPPRIPYGMSLLLYMDVHVPRAITRTLPSI